MPVWLVLRTRDKLAALRVADEEYVGDHHLIGDRAYAGDVTLDVRLTILSDTPAPMTCVS